MNDSPHFLATPNPGAITTYLGQDGRFEVRVIFHNFKIAPDLGWERRHQFSSPPKMYRATGIAWVRFRDQRLAIADLVEKSFDFPTSIHTQNLLADNLARHFWSEQINVLRQIGAALNEPSFIEVR